MTTELDQELTRLTNSAASTVDFPGSTGEAVPEGEVPSNPMFDMTGPQLLYLVYDNAAKYAPNWHLKEDEIEQLANFHGMLLDKYGADFLKRYGLEVIAIYTTFKILGPRLKTPLKIPTEKKETKPDE
ncbi:MAG: hypothetical protein COB04_18760 [Gammaproteobacteria bacterium]|nr:MAG: hypothetical protein COB04_18760 [Gammaproteobacteria bacterium]